ncbi:unnamed protein product, partial [Effrenium voratum]
RPGLSRTAEPRGKVVVPVRRQNVRPKRTVEEVLEEDEEDEDEEEEPGQLKQWASEVDSPKRQRCDAMCLADELDLERICSAWAGAAEQGSVPAARARRLSADVCVLELEDGRLCFAFAFGSIVSWGLTWMELRRLRRLIRKSAG